MDELSWAVSASASAVQASGPAGHEAEEWPLMSAIRGVGPDGRSIAPKPTGKNMIIFDPELPVGSKIYAGDNLLLTVEPNPESR